MQVIAIPDDLSYFSVTTHTAYYTSTTEVQILCWLASQISGNIFEIGCNEGKTTRDLALNYPNKIVYAVDYLGESATLAKEQYRERPEHSKSLCHLARGLPNVRVWNHNSHSFDYEQLKDVQLIFIDGDHSFEAVKEDTTNALFYLQKNGGGIIAWHDYVLGTCSDGWMAVKRYIDEYIRPIYSELTWIEHTRLVFLKVV